MLIAGWCRVVFLQCARNSSRVLCVLALRKEACRPSSGPITRAGTPLGQSSEHDGFSSCGLRDLKAASRTSRTR